MDACRGKREERKEKREGRREMSEVSTEERESFGRRSQETLESGAVVGPVLNSHRDRAVVWNILIIFSSCGNPAA